MKLRLLLAVTLWLLLLTLAAAQLAAAQVNSGGDKENAQSKLHKELAPRPYTFDDYIADLKQSARTDKPKPVNPVTEEQSKVAANKHKNYKPLNPFVVEW